MAVSDDLRRLSQMDGIYVGYVVQTYSPFTGWFKGRLQQANDGNWIVRSSSQDGGVIGFQLGQVRPDWSSSESPNSGIMVSVPLVLNTTIGTQQQQISIGSVYLQQQLPLELTN
jgi:hypothetical protein